MTSSYPLEICSNILSSGIKTNRDHFLTDVDLKALESRIQTMRENKIDDELFGKTYHLSDGNYWNTTREREKLRRNDNWRNQFYRLAYRPFDTRWIYYQPNLIEIRRGGASKEIMRHFFNGNLGLISARNSKASIVNHFYCCDTLVEMKCGESTIQSYVFPLYIHGTSDKKGLFHAEGDTKEPNIKPEIFKSLSKAYKKNISPEEIFYYIYAVLYSETYRTKYAEFLKIDFPRVPFTKDYKLFKKMSEHGNRLVNLHLLKSQELDSPITRFQVEGSNRVDKPKYNPTQPPLRGGEGGVTGRVYINKEQYFEGISGKAWTYQIGGYQVCDKWLKDRKKRILSLDEIQTYCRIVTAIQKTLEIQKAIDEVYADLEKEIISFMNLDHEIDRYSI